jgi:hypothetical protein
MEGKTIYCECGCGIVIGQPMEFIDGEWCVMPISETRLRELHLMRHPTIQTSSHTSDTALCVYG